MFSRKKSSNCSSGQVEFCFDYAVKKFLLEGPEFFAPGKKQYSKNSIFLKSFRQNVSLIT